MKLISAHNILCSFAAISLLTANVTLAADTEALVLSLPAPTLKGTPEQLPTGPGIEANSDKAPAALQIAKGAKNVALDQTRKAYQSMNAERMRAAGVKSFEWIHSGGGQKPRPDHVAMSGNVYRYDNLPVIDKRTGERGIPGQAPNCRCTARPVLDFGD